MRRAEHRSRSPRAHASHIRHELRQVGNVAEATHFVLPLGGGIWIMFPYPQSLRPLYLVSTYFKSLADKLNFWKTPGNLLAKDDFVKARRHQIEVKLQLSEEVCEMCLKPDCRDPNCGDASDDELDLCSDAPRFLR